MAANRVARGTSSGARSALRVRGAEPRNVAGTVIFGASSVAVAFKVVFSCSVSAASSGSGASSVILVTVVVLVDVDTRSHSTPSASVNRVTYLLVDASSGAGASSAGEIGRAHV